MNKVKIAIQKGLEEVKNMLLTEGFNVVDYETSGLDADVTIITGVDEAYEEIQPAEYHSNGKKNMLVIDATNSSPGEILKRVHMYFK